LVRISAGTPVVFTKVFVAFLRYQHGTRIRRRPLASKSFPIHRSPIILPFNDGKTERLKCRKKDTKKKVGGEREERIEIEGEENENKENREKEKDEDEWRRKKEREKKE
jgi:hypothetical protein